MVPFVCASRSLCVGSWLAMRTFKKRQVVCVVGVLVWAVWLSALGVSRGAEVISENWPFPFTMIFGSVVAGASSVGGGAVAFPVFTKWLSVLPQDAKVFSLAIQSVGMGAATLAIVFGRVRVDWRVIRWASAGGVGGVLIGTVLLSPHMIPPVVKMSFTMMMASFAFTLWVLNRGHRECHDALPEFSTRERGLLFLAGLVGGMMSGLVGNGVDIVVFSMMVLLFRVSEKVATPTSVVLMALNAMVGFAIVGPGLSQFTPEIREWWLASIPVVVWGAPLGVVLCTLMSRVAVARLLIGLIAVELVSSLILIPLTTKVVSISLVVGLLFGGVSVLMARARRYAP